jgi:hypothetical protein
MGNNKFNYNNKLNNAFNNMRLTNGDVYNNKLNNNNTAQRAINGVPPLRKVVLDTLYKQSPNGMKELDAQTYKYTGMSSTQLRNISKTFPHIYVKKKMQDGNPVFSLILRPQQFPMNKANNTWVYNNRWEKFNPHY